MNALIEILSHALLQFLWQGTLIALLVWCALHIFRRSSSLLRYWVLCIGMVAMIAAPILTGFQAGYLVISSSSTGALSSQTSIQIEQSEIPRDLKVAPLPPRERESLSPSPFVWAWMAGVAMLSLWRWFHWRRIWRLAMPDHLQAVPDSCLQLLEQLRTQISVRQEVLLAYSKGVQVPCVIGALKPRILLPLGILSSIDKASLKAILAHELMHIRRHDYLINLFQTAIETLLFYHPAVWWLGRRLRVEREYCCDDGALKVCASRKEYSQALLQLEENRSSEPALAASATQHLLKRIKRILAPEVSTDRLTSALPASICGVITLSLAVSFLLLPDQASIAEEGASTPDEEITAKGDPLARLQGLAARLKELKATLSDARGIDPDALRLQRFLDNPSLDEDGKGALQQFNVILRRAHDFSDTVPGTETKWCLKIDAPVDGLDGGFCFVSKSSALGHEVHQDLTWLESHFPVVSLRWTTDPGFPDKPYVELAKIEAADWRSIDITVTFKEIDSESEQTQVPSKDLQEAVDELDALVAEVSSLAQVKGTKPESALTKTPVTINGEVNAPRPIDWRDGLTIKDAVDQANGFTPFARKDGSRLIRGGKSEPIDLTKAEILARKLLPGDKIIVIHK